MTVEVKPAKKSLDRLEFLKCAGLFGFCACTAPALATSGNASAAQADDPEVEGLRSRLEFVQTRFAKLLEILNESLDEPTMAHVLEEMGSECARNFSQVTDSFKGELAGFLAEIRKQWVETVEHDEENRVIRVVDRSPKCTCAFVDEQKTPDTFCNCSVGWQKEAYSTVIGKPVEVEVEQSILRGSNRCVFVIRYA